MLLEVCHGNAYGLGQNLYCTYICILWYSRFGVCCVQIIKDDSDTDVNYNDTYIQNPDYPNSYGDEGTITYKINKIDNSK